MLIDPRVATDAVAAMERTWKVAARLPGVG
jgi:hypothetical protein